MSKFNAQKNMRTVNSCGHAAYVMPEKQKLVTQVLTSFFNEEKFYGDNTADMVKTIKAVIEQDPEFVAKLAVFARREFNMRSVSHVLAAYLAHEPAGKRYARKVVNRICVRGDDATEIMSFYLSTFGKPIPNSLRRGLKDVLERFDIYTLAKYKGAGKAVKMRDLVALCRPAPKSNAAALAFKMLLAGTLDPPYTWEVEISKYGNNKETWERLIASKKVGHMAILRNLRNIIKAKPSNLDDALTWMTDPAAVMRSKQLPFRFLSAYKAVADVGTSRIFRILEQACMSSLENMPRLPGTTAIFLDVSGSMSSHVSEKSHIRCYEIGALIGLMANRICDDSVFYTFNNSASKYQFSGDEPLLKTATEFRCGGDTNMAAPFEMLKSSGLKVDRIIVISDNECNSVSTWFSRKPVQAVVDDYRRATGSNCWVHAIDLMGYGTQQFAGPKTNIIAGWSEKVFDFIRLAEQGEGSLESAIQIYEY